MTNFEELMKNMNPDLLTWLVTDKTYFKKMIKCDQYRGVPLGCPCYDDGYPYNCEDCLLEWLEREAREE